MSGVLMNVTGDEVGISAEASNVNDRTQHASRVDVSRDELRAIDTNLSYPLRPRRVSQMPAMTTSAPMSCSGCNLSPRSTAAETSATNGVRFE